MSDWSNYPLPTGAATEYGVVEQVSVTAYKIGGDWYPHAKIHGPRGWAEPLVVML